MARYKAYDLKQTKMIPLSYADQIVEGSFEHALCEIVEEHLDLSAFEKRYANEETGRPAYDPKLLLKIVLYRRVFLRPRSANRHASLVGHPEKKAAVARALPDWRKALPIKLVTDRCTSAARQSTAVLQTLHTQA